MKILLGKVCIASLLGGELLIVGCSTSPRQLAKNLVVEVSGKPTPKQLADNLAAAVRGKEPDKVKALLNAGADPTLPVEGQTSAVDLAAMEVNRSNDQGNLAWDGSDKELQVLLLMTSNLRHRRQELHFEGPVSVAAEYHGIGPSGKISLVADVIIRDGNGDHELFLSRFETTTKNINREELDQIIGSAFPITLGDTYKVTCTHYSGQGQESAQGCEVDYIEHLGSNTKQLMSVPVGEFLPSTAHILNEAKLKGTQ